MKELTIEQKAKAYDEAKARMSKAYNSNRCTIGFMNEIFPEFKDEDERIKEEIINYFECQSRDEPCRKSIHDKWIAWIEKQGQTFTKEDTDNANKVEPKFKAGNWYQCTKDFFGKGVTFDKNTAYYCAQEGCLQNEYGCHIAIVKDLYDNFKLWTIQDARDGDVLCCESGWTCIFKTLINYETFSSYCFMDETKWFCETGSECHTLKEEFIKAYNGKIYPATKEQRNNFFVKMKEAGFEWDAEKRELKMISQRMISAEAKEAIYGKLTAWSEEDSTYYDDICEILINLIHSETAKINKDVVQKDLDWLISIKNRVIPQPMQEWNKEDEKMYRRLYNLIYFTPYCDSRKKLSDWLKTIKQKIVTK